MRFVERAGFHRLSFRGRLTLVAAAAVAATTIAASVATYFFVQSQLTAAVDGSLRALTGSVTVSRGAPGLNGSSSGTIVAAGGAAPILPPSQLGGAAGYVQSVDASGQTTLAPYETVYLPTSTQDRAVAGGKAPAYFHDEYVGGTHLRVLTSRLGDGLAVQVGRPMDEVDSTMAALRLLLIGVAAGGVLLAALLGRLVARAALAPVQRLSDAVDHVTVTGDLRGHVPDGGADELSRLGANFNRMLAALRHSLKSQRQLVADASHELRTPLASLRTNVEVLERAPRLPVMERKKLVRDLVFQSEQLSRLVHDLIDLARDDQPLEAVGPVQLDALVGQAVERATSHWPRVEFVGRLQRTVVTGEGDRIERAVANLLDNAGKWSPPGGVVEVEVAAGEVTVRDHGPGIDPGDVPHVFDRFWRAAAARALPGSGLGLSIVKQVAEAHGATIGAESPEGGGTLMRLRFASSTLPDS
jgi:two-component system, OmpR family, sensor histidine kinase MprB